MEIRELNFEEVPAQLLEIPQAPKKLSIIGNLPKGGYKFLTIVGSRHFTNYGKDCVEKLVREISGYPIVIVSGLAMGIDTIAHREAIKNKMTTIAFPGSGLDEKVIYPRSNLNLAKEIVASGGAIISEFKHDQGGAEWTFPSRNRLMAGISDAVLIVEASEKSGTLITARMATDYNRDVLTIPGNIFSDNSVGPNELLKVGATPITCGNDILRALGFDPRESNGNKEALNDCTQDEIKILELLNEPTDKDELIERSGMESYVVFSIISMLEMKNLIKEDNGEIRRI